MTADVGACFEVRGKRSMFLSQGVQVLCAALLTLGTTQVLSQPFYKEASSFHTIRYDSSTPPNVIRDPHCRSGSGPGNEKSADVGVVEFGEDGGFLDRGQLDRVLECIGRARATNPQGTVVMIFVHGWRHDASWDDQNFRDFRTVLLSLALREAERYGSSYRRVVGVYLGWPGGRITQFTSRYRVAQAVGRGDAMTTTLREIIRATKAPTASESLGSPVVLAGHSMGAMALQTAFDSLLQREDFVAEASDAEKRRCTKVYQQGKVVGGFPDLVLLLNSATDSQITKGLVKRFQEKGLSKIVDCGKQRFEAPLMISASSVDDYATTWLYWAATLGRNVTDGNDKELINHRLRAAGTYDCPPIPGVPDFNQSWHCLREPTIRQGQVETINVDLPQFELERARDKCHLRFQLTRTAAPGSYLPLWVFRVPGELIEDHGDIFNGRSRLLAMAMIQVSGATMSVFGSYQAMFEPELSTCTLPG